MTGHKRAEACTDTFAHPPQGLLVRPRPDGPAVSAWMLTFEPGAGFPYYDTFLTAVRFRSDRGQAAAGEPRARGSFVSIALEVDRRPKR